MVEPSDESEQLLDGFAKTLAAVRKTVEDGWTRIGLLDSMEESKKLTLPKAVNEIFDQLEASIHDHDGSALLKDEIRALKQELDDKPQPNDRALATLNERVIQLNQDCIDMMVVLIAIRDLARRKDPDIHNRVVALLGIDRMTKLLG